MAAVLVVALQPEPVVQQGHHLYRGDAIAGGEDEGSQGWEGCSLHADEQTGAAARGQAV